MRLNASTIFLADPPAINILDEEYLGSRLAMNCAQKFAFIAWPALIAAMAIFHQVSQAAVFTMDREKGRWLVWVMGMFYAMLRQEAINS